MNVPSLNVMSALSQRTGQIPGQSPCAETAVISQCNSRLTSQPFILRRDLSLHVPIKQRMRNGADAALINYENGGKYGLLQNLYNGVNYLSSHILIGLHMQNCTTLSTTISKHCPNEPYWSGYRVLDVIMINRRATQDGWNQR